MAEQVLFSATTGGFYLDGVSSQIPEDAAPISERRHQQLLANGGADIGACPKTGKPISTASNVTAAQQRAALVLAIKAEAARRITAQSPLWRQLNDLRMPSEAGDARFARIDAIRLASSLIESQLADTPANRLDAFPISNNPFWPEL